MFDAGWMKDVDTHECLFRVERSLVINVEPYDDVYYHEHFNPICGLVWPLLCYLDGKNLHKGKVHIRRWMFLARRTELRPWWSSSRRSQSLFSVQYRSYLWSLKSYSSSKFCWSRCCDIREYYEASHALAWRFRPKKWFKIPGFCDLQADVVGFSISIFVSLDRWVPQWLEARTAQYRLDRVERPPGENVLT